MKCKQCELLQEHNRYLQSLVDKLLIAGGINPVNAQSINMTDKINDLMKEESLETFASTQEEYGG